jgi:hypothetical protein
VSIGPVGLTNGTLSPDTNTLIPTVTAVRSICCATKSLLYAIVAHFLCLSFPYNVNAETLAAS